MVDEPEFASYRDARQYPRAIRRVEKELTLIRSSIDGHFVIWTVPERTLVARLTGNSSCESTVSQYEHQVESQREPDVPT